MAKVPSKRPHKQITPYDVARKINAAPPMKSNIVTDALVKKYKSSATQKDKDLVGAMVKLKQESDRSSNSISGTVAMMQKTLEDTRKDVQKIGPKGGVEKVSKSTESILTKLGYTVDNLTKGVKQIMVDTAKGTKDALAAYSKAISEDISVNKQNVVAMALARTSPLFGYFVSRFVETDVFKKAASKMGSILMSPFKRKEKGFGREGGVPHMQHGGYVERGGTAMLHSAEVVMPIDKLLARIDERYRESREEGEKKNKKRMGDWFRLWSRYSLGLTTRAIKREKLGRRGLMASFVGGLKEEFQTTELPALERIATEITELREATIKSSTTLEKLGAAWRTALYEHPVFRSMVGLVKTYTKTITFPWKLIFKAKGKYDKNLPRTGRNVFQNMSGILATIYVGMMWKADEVLDRLDILVKQAGGKVPGRLKRAPRKKSIAGKAVGLITSPIEALADKIKNKIFGERKEEKPIVVIIQEEMLLEQQKTSDYLSKLLELADGTRKKAPMIQLVDLNQKQLVEQKRSKKTFLEKLMWLPMLLIGFFRAKLIPSLLKIPSLIWRFVGPVLTPIGSGIMLLMKKLGITTLASKVAPYAGPAALAAGVGWAGIHAYKGVKRAGEWFGVPEGEKVGIGKRIAAGIGGFFGGVDAGAKGAVKGVAKGAMIGAGLGSVVPFFGTAIGGAVGAIAGGILGFIGGKNIAKGLAFIGSKIKKLAKGMWDWFTYIYTLPGKAMTKIGEIIKDKWKETSGSLPVKISKMAGWFFYEGTIGLLLRGMKWIGSYLGDLWTKFSLAVGPKIGKVAYGIVAWPLWVLESLTKKAFSNIKELIGWDQMKKKFQPLFSTFEFIGGIISKIKGYVVEKMKGIPGIGGVIKWWQTHREESITDKALIAKYDIEKKAREKEILERVKNNSRSTIISSMVIAGLTKKEAEKRWRKFKKSDTYDEAMRLASEAKESEAMKLVRDYSSKTRSEIKSLMVNEKVIKAKEKATRQKSLLGGFWGPTIKEQSALISEYWKGKSEDVTKTKEYGVVKESVTPVVSRTKAMMVAAQKEVAFLKQQAEKDKKTIAMLKNLQNIVVNNVNDVKNAVTNSSSSTIEGGGGITPDSGFAGGPRATWTQLVLEGEL